MELWKKYRQGVFVLACSLCLLFLPGCYQIAPQLVEGADIADLQAHYQAGERHEKKRDYSSAYFSYLEAAKQGYAPAQAALGFLYFNGRGSRQEGVAAPMPGMDAKFWFELAAAQDDAGGQYGMGELYYYGKSKVPRDTHQAVHWYERAAQKGYLRAQLALVQLYWHGRGKDGTSNLPPGIDDIRNPQKGFFWLEQAAQQGHAPSQYELGMAYQRKGEGQDLNKAQHWYAQAAAQDYYRAKVALMLLSGEAGHYPCYVRGLYGIPMRQPGIARRADDWCL